MSLWSEELASGNRLCGSDRKHTPHIDAGCVMIRDSSFVRAEDGVRVKDYDPVVHIPTMPLKSRELEAVRNRRKGPVI